ncbi:MAG: hypothetical protein HY783_07750 [Chloroflexi bacterium]|nr:hypothetical protein [Chloroflexota bacterium]
MIRGDFVGKDSHVWIEDKGKESEFYSVKDHGYSVENGKVTDMGEGSGAIVGLWKLSYLGAAMGLAVASGGQITPQGSEVINGRNTDKYVADSTVLTALLGKAKAVVNIDKETGALVKMVSDWKGKDANFFSCFLSPSLSPTAGAFQQPERNQGGR